MLKVMVMAAITQYFHRFRVLVAIAGHKRYTSWKEKIVSGFKYNQNHSGNVSGIKNTSPATILSE
jgi:hypothetical protein